MGTNISTNPVNTGEIKITGKKENTRLKGSAVKEKVPSGMSSGEKVSLKKTNKSGIPANILAGTEKEVTGLLTKEGLISSSKKIARAGITGVPLDAAFNIFKFHSGKIDSRQFMAKSSNGLFSWAAFETGMIATTAVAAKVTGTKLGPLGTLALGGGIGMVTSSLYHKTVGHKVEKQLHDLIPEKVAVPVAKTLDRYFAKPIDKYVLTPIKENPVEAGVIGVIATTALAIKYPLGFGKNILLATTGATAISLTGNFALNKLFDSDENTKKEIKGVSVNSISANKWKIQKPALVLPSINTPISKEELKWAISLEKAFKSDKNSISDTDVAKYNNILARSEKSK